MTLDYERLSREELISRLVDAQARLEEARQRDVGLYDAAPVPCCTFDRDGVVLEINVAGASLLGRERERIVGKSFMALVRLVNPDVFVRHLCDCHEAATRVTSELTLVTDQGPLDLQLISTAEPARRGAGARFRTALIDVTSLRAAERQVRAAHETERAHRRQMEAIDRAVAAVNGSLAQASRQDLASFFQVIVDQARQITNAEFAALGISSGAGRPFEPWIYSGMSAAQAAAIGRVPRLAGLLAAVELAAEPIRLRDLHKHDAFSGFPAHHPPITSFLGLSIQFQGQVLGNLYLGNKRGACEFSAEDQQALKGLADRTGTALELARLRQVEAREHVRLEFLARAGPMLAESIDYQDTLGAIARVLVPAAADLCTIDILEEDGALRKVAAHHRDRQKQKWLDRLMGVTSYGDLPDAIRAAIETAQPRRFDGAPEFLREGMSGVDYAELQRELGATCSLVAPLTLRGSVQGVLRLAMAGSGRKFTDADLPLARELAHHAALAIDRARLYRQAKKAVRARDDMFTLVSHDLRNYLNTVKMGAQMLTRRGQDERRAGRKQVQAILNSANRMDQLIESLRDATMIETGHFTVAPRVEDLAQLVEEAIKTLEPQVVARSLELTVQLDAGGASVYCDRGRVLQVLANLVGNAVKFTRAPGEIRVAAWTRDDAVCFSVSDTGAGIAERHLAHIFDRYWKGRDAQVPGTGLGLFIARGIVEAHHGQIWVESQVGSGTTFFFSLPASAPSQDHAPRDTPSPATAAPPGP